MEKILFIDATTRPQSRTLRLARHLLGKLSGEVTELRLEEEDIRPLNTESLQYRQELLAEGNFDDPMLRYAWQFRQADTIVVAAPYYDLSFSSLLKVYLENICCVGLTFYYDDREIARTLCNARKLYYVSTGGDVLKKQFGFQYVEAVMQEFFEIPEITGFFAQKLDLRDSDPEEIMKQAIREVDQFFL